MFRFDNIQAVLKYKIKTPQSFYCKCFIFNTTFFGRLGHLQVILKIKNVWEGTFFSYIKANISRGFLLLIEMRIYPAKTEGVI
jgi:hypothetical protein